MARVNKATDGVFAKLFVGENRQVKIEDFLEANNPESPSANLRKLIKAYKESVNSEKLKVERIALLEELIMQMRSRENITDVKVTFVRDYIYARTPFYRRDKPVKDVRVLVDNRELWKKYSIKKLYSDEGFMEKVMEKLVSHMNAIIDMNLKRLLEIDAQLAEETPVIQKVQPKSKAAKSKAPAKTKATKVTEMSENKEETVEAL